MEKISDGPAPIKEEKASLADVLASARRSFEQVMADQNNPTVIIDADRGPKWEKISLESEAYKNKREIKKDETEIITQDEAVFGAGLLGSIEIANMTKLPRTEQRIKKKMAEARAILNQVSQRRPKDAQLFWEPALKDEEIKKTIEALGIYPTAVNLQGNMDNLPDDLFVKITEKYVEDFRKIEDEFVVEIEVELEMAMSAMRQNLAEYGIEYDSAKMEERLKTVSIRLADPIMTTFEHVGGWYNDFTAAILIRNDLLREGGDDVHFSFVLRHELFHALSGRVAYREIWHEEDEDGFAQAEYVDLFGENIVGGRVGLAFGPFPLEGGERNGRFDWLNEAVTETLSYSQEERELIGGFMGYGNERVLYQLLLHGGKAEIPEKLFVEAYLEDYEPGDNPIPKWKELWHSLQENYEPGILVKLDKLVKSGGAKAAYAYLVENYPNVRKYVDKKRQEAELQRYQKVLSALGGKSAAKGKSKKIRDKK